MRVSVLNVSQINAYIKSLIDGEEVLNGLFICGEISNFNHHYKSGHMYFSLKDEKSLINAVMFSGDVKRLKFNLKDGMKVIIRGRISVYEAAGRYQLYAEDIQPDGLGALNLAFEQLKEKLEKEGLFAEVYKKPIPKFPNKIAVITSPTGAAVQDILNILKRRWPVADVKIYPVSVQGELAVSSLTEALHKVSETKEADVVIIGRGGGSIEDLWAFNNETLARLIYSCPIPVISAVGHETDFTICDFVADLRAPTPSAAAEIATPDINEVKAKVDNLYRFMYQRIKRNLENKSMKLDFISTSKAFKSMNNMFSLKQARLDMLKTALEKAVHNNLQNKFARLSSASDKLDALSPLKVLSRGYAVLFKDGKKVSDYEDFNVGDSLDITTHSAKIKVLVEEKEAYNGK